MKKWKNAKRYYPITHVHHKWRSYDVWFLKYKVQEREFLSFWVIFYLFAPQTTWKIKFRKIEKKKKKIGDIIIYWRYYHLTHVHQKWHLYDIWFLRYGVQHTICFVILDRFLPFYSPKNPENKNFVIINKTPGDIIIFHKCTINNNHMMYGSWVMERNRQNVLSFWTIFCPFTPLTSQKIKILKKWKNVRRYHDFTQVH